MPLEFMVWVPLGARIWSPYANAYTLPPLRDWCMYVLQKTKGDEDWVTLIQNSCQFFTEVRFTKMLTAIYLFGGTLPFKNSAKRENCESRA